MKIERVITDPMGEQYLKTESRNELFPHFLKNKERFNLKKDIFEKSNSLKGK